jgi:pleiotropic regulator 1
LRSRLITCEADKTIKIWAEDSMATQETHPIDMKGWTEHVKAHKTY